MSRDFSLAILSDVHYACAAEQAAGDDYEIRAIRNPFLRFLLANYRHFVWLRHPLRQNGQLDRFLSEVSPVDYVIANGDYSCNVGAVGVSDPAARQSARECLDKLRGRFGERLLTTVGDHELGKLRLLGTRGGLRLESWQCAIAELGLSTLRSSELTADESTRAAAEDGRQPLPPSPPNPPSPFDPSGEGGLGGEGHIHWRLELGNYVLIGVVSTLVALPVFAQEMLPEEKPVWEKLRELHLAEIRAAFAGLRPDQRVLLFCHDPTALPFLWRDESVRAGLPQIEQTIIGHLHSNLFLRLSRVLSGMPRINFLGSSVRKLSTALNESPLWRPFKVRLCPSLAGIELLKDGGYFTMKLDGEAKRPAEFTFHPLPR